MERARRRPASGAVSGHDGPVQRGVVKGIEFEPPASTGRYPQSPRQPLRNAYTHAKTRILPGPNGNEYRREVGFPDAGFVKQLLNPWQQLDRVVALTAPRNVPYETAFP